MMKLRINPLVAKDLKSIKDYIAEGVLRRIISMWCGKIMSCCIRLVKR